MVTQLKHVQVGLIRQWLEDFVSNGTDTTPKLKEALEIDGYEPEVIDLYCKGYRFVAKYFSALTDLVRYRRVLTAFEGCFIKVEFEDGCWNYRYDIMREDPDQPDHFLRVAGFSFIYVLGKGELSPQVVQKEFRVPKVTGITEDNILTLDSVNALNYLATAVAAGDYHSFEAIPKLDTTDFCHSFKASRKRQRGEYYSYATLLYALGPETQWTFESKLTGDQDE